MAKKIKRKLKLKPKIKIISKTNSRETKEN